MSQNPQSLATPAPKAKLGFVRHLRLTFKEAVVALLIGNFVVTGGLWIKVATQKPPVIATVGVTALTRLYASRIANDSNTTPEQVSLKTQLFQDLVRKEIQRLAVKKGVVILAREAVLTGDSEDLTPVLEDAVSDAMKATPTDPAPKGGIDDSLLH